MALSVALAGACGSQSNDTKPQPTTAATSTQNASKTGDTSASPGKATPMTKLSPEEMIKPPTRVEPMLGLRDLSREQVLSLMKVAPGDVASDVAYEKLTGVSRVSNGEVFAGHFFLRGDEVVMVYVGDPDFLSGLSADEIEKELGGEGEILRSRAGKTSNQHVYADKGVAFSEDDGKLDFLEIFAPMSLDDYKAKIYNDVGPFTK